MLEVIIDGDLGSAASVAEGRFEGDHGLLWSSAHAAEIGGGEVTRFTAKFLKGFEADQAPTNNAVERGEDAGTPPWLGVRNEVPLGESVFREVQDAQKDPF